MHLELASCKSMKGVSIMNDQRVFDMELVKVESLEKAVRTPFYETDSTGGSVWVIKPGQTLPKHYHHNSDDIWVILQAKISHIYGIINKTSYSFIWMIFNGFST